ncbi:electron transferring flavoprotein dehydrogenase [Legionella pneumophila]|nr:electron transferring flavoprotein dehydrogenase [Legionella pneumophila]
MQSGMLAAQACFDALSEEKSGQFELSSYSEKINQSWLKQELYAVRNIRPGFKYGLFPGLINAALETYVTRGYSPWTLKNHADHKSLIPAEKAKKLTILSPMACSHLINSHLYFYQIHFMKKINPAISS